MTWFAHRRSGGAIASLHRARQPDYAEEALADDHADVVAFFTPTPAQLDAEAASSLDANKAARVLAGVLFDHENRLRTLEARGTVTAAQFRQALVDRYKVLA